jgi:multicomponent Na+:H+ antiporter subunit G
MTATDLVGLALVALGTGFFWAGAIGVLRFPDAFTRLHAITKADNFGLALVALGVGCLAAAWDAALRLALIWSFVAAASATTGHLIARHALRARRGRGR